MPTSIAMLHGKVVVDDAMAGATLLMQDGDATWKPGALIAHMRDVTATTIAAPKASAASLEIHKLSGQPPMLKIEGGELALWPRMALSSIKGSITSNPQNPRLFTIDLSGGYGGVAELWTAKGPLDTTALTATIELEAKKFQLDRLAPILAKTPVVDYANTSIDTKVKLALDRNGATFDGQFHLSGLNVGHPMLADKEVHDLDLSGVIQGSYDRSKRVLALTKGDFVTREVPFSVTGSATKTTTAVAVNDKPGEPAPRHGPGGIQLLDLQFKIPPIECQRVLDAIPTEMAPYMAGYKLRGTFDVDLKLGVDWERLDDTVLGGHVGIKQCKVTSEPADSPKRLQKEFEHYVEIEKGKWHSFIVGESNEDFVLFEDISPYLVKSIMSTEDSAFYFHRGFITSEFRTALVNDLKAGAFRYGASSITMQMVKNVLLYREKTLARKLQELFLTWHVENVLGALRHRPGGEALLRQGAEGSQPHRGRVLLDDPPVAEGALQAVLRRHADQVDHRQDQPDPRHHAEARSADARGVRQGDRHAAGVRRQAGRGDRAGVPQAHQRRDQEVALDEPDEALIVGKTFARALLSR
jgi:hypothetical protein